MEKFQALFYLASSFKN